MRWLGRSRRRLSGWATPEPGDGSLRRGQAAHLSVPPSPVANSVAEVPRRTSRRRLVWPKGERRKQNQVNLTAVLRDLALPSRRSLTRFGRIRPDASWVIERQQNADGGLRLRRAPVIASDVRGHGRGHCRRSPAVGRAATGAGRSGRRSGHPHPVTENPERGFPRATAAESTPQSTAWARCRG